MSTELAWAAGFFDGEGSTHIHMSSTKIKDKTYPYARLRMEVSQVDLRNLERFQNAVEMGRISKRYVSGQDRSRNQPISRWYTSRDGDVHRVIELLKPYLSPGKIEQYFTANAKRDAWRTSHPDRRRKKRAE